MGFGRTGLVWCETYGVLPDIIPIAKGLSSGYFRLGSDDQQQDNGCI
ncbi:MAG: hypothetical protein Ct9H300mP28_34930 [Pseudomonadota bacterium]|nr:MAG: hypothetical protein Ct9H300mP28_34930 [Pseudomonadota bacterium]